MKQIQACAFILTGVFSFLCCIFRPAVGGTQICEPWTGKVVSLQGRVQVQRAGSTRWDGVRLNDTFCLGDMIQIREHSRAAILLSNEAILRLDQKTTLIFPELEKEPADLIDLLNGAVHFFSRTPRRLKVNTPFVNAAIGGTEFLVHVESDQTFISVFEGRVSATNNAGSLSLTTGQSAVTRAGQAPAFRTVVRPRDAVQWALYYPPVREYRPGDFPGGTESDWQRKVRNSVEFFREGDLAQAFSSLKDVPADLRDPNFFTYRAGLLLYVGRVDEAAGDIEKALTLDPNNSDAFSLQTVIAVVQNKKDKALDFAKKAVEMDPESDTARVARSYADQAHFELQKALNSLKEAVKLNPENALAWARLAEILLSVGNLDKAVEAANQAVILNPNLARTHTVLGFANLTRIKIDGAKVSTGSILPRSKWYSRDSSPSPIVIMASLASGCIGTSRSPSLSRYPVMIAPLSITSR